MEQPRKVIWLSTIVLAIFHIGAIAALFMFSWRAFAAMLVLYWIAGCLGVCIGYHRLHTHRSYRVPKAVDYFLATCGSLTFEGGPISWVATHRIHHQKSDQPGDPHSPRDGAWWSHIGWIVLGDANHNNTRIMSKYAPDLAKQPYYVWLNNYHYVPTLVVAAILYALGGLPFVMWGIFVRVVLCFHATWLVNSATHMWGSRRFATKDDSTNNWWVAMITFGEGWHNNHHAHPTSARHGLAWYELDIGWLHINLMKFLGIAKAVKVAKVASELPEMVSPELVSAD